LHIDILGSSGKGEAGYRCGWGLYDRQLGMIFADADAFFVAKRMLVQISTYRAARNANIT